MALAEYFRQRRYPLPDGHDATLAYRLHARTAVVGECVEWTGAKGSDGYGHWSSGKRRVPAHRLSWWLHHGTIHLGKFVLHKCDNPPCVRIDHLFVGSKRDNALDAIAKGRWRAGRRKRLAYCPAGHVMTGYQRTKQKTRYTSRQFCRECFPTWRHDEPLEPKPPLSQPRPAGST